ncbi:hypothetical protein [Arsenicibacter rosenii]|uniref:hypothetical protein n=1 Tax=Arsenicibacter rosenii TaxID=1750698 RepID=UPI0008F86FCB|nr:hypothetical protein [Arsenicibacter rosenii]
MKLFIRKYWFIGTSLCVGSAIYIWNQGSGVNEMSESENPVRSHKQPVSAGYAKRVFLDSDTSTVEPVSFDRYRPQ